MERKENDGPWIFVSHSLKDWEQIRDIRNVIENEGGKPLLFFLKCLNDESEIVNLIKREIIERHFFLLCNSKYAEKSEWVRTEVDFVKTLENKVFIEINLEESKDQQRDKIKRLIKRATVFVSYSRIDRDIALEITEIFRENDYAVFFDQDSLSPGENWRDANSNAISESVANGFFIILLSNNWINSIWGLEELDFAIRNLKDKKGNIIPILLDNPQLIAQQLPLTLQEIQWVDFSSGDLTKNTIRLIENLKKRNMY